MTENEKSQPEGEDQGDLAFAEPGGAEKPEEEEGYRLAEEVSPEGKTAAQTADWYYTIGDRPRQGPVSLGDLQRLVAAGQLGRQDQVWRRGLTEWAAVADVPELLQDPGPPPPPKLRPVVPEATPDAMAALRPLERKLTSPLVLRITGWACGGLGAFLLVLAVPLAFFWRGLFPEALLFLFAFLVFHALARVIEAVER